MWQVLSMLLIVCGICGKVGAVLTTIPHPVVHAATIIILSLGLARSVHPLSLVDLRSKRNATVLGLALAVGLMSPTWMHKQIVNIHTGIAGI